MDHLRYPIGRAPHRKQITAEQRKHWIGTLRRFPALLRLETTGLTVSELERQYRQDSWTIAQLVHHCADSHTNSLVRFKWTLTEAQPTIKPYDEKRWVELPDATQSSVTESLDYLEQLHRKWTRLLERMTEAQFARTFFHPDQPDPIRLDQLTAHYAWHCAHHLAHVRLALDRPLDLCRSLI